MLGFIIPFCFCQTSEPRATWGRRMRIRTHIGADSSSGSGASCRDARPHYWPSELNIMNFSPNLITGTFNEYYLSITKVHITVYWRSNLLSNVTFAGGQELFCIKVFGPPSLWKKFTLILKVSRDCWLWTEVKVTRPPSTLDKTQPTKTALHILKDIW